MSHMHPIDPSKALSAAPERYLTPNREWVDLLPSCAQQPQLIRCGITKKLLEEFFEITYLAFLPLEGEVLPEQPFALIETTKAAFELYPPISGFFSQNNLPLSTNPQQLFLHPEAPDNWLIELSLPVDFTFPTTWRKTNGTPS